MPKIRISLEGSEKVIAQLKELGFVGEQSVKKIQAASAGGFGGDPARLRAMGNAAEEAARGFALSRREIAALRTALRQLDLGAVGGQFAALARVAGVFGPVALGLTAIGAAAATAIGALGKFASGAVEVADALTKLSDVSGISFENLSVIQQAFAQGGTDAKTFANEFTKLFEDVGQASKTAADDVKESSAETAKAEADAMRVRIASGQTIGVQNEQILRQLDKRAAKEQAEIALTKSQITIANDLGNAIKQFQSLAGGGNAVFNALTTVETKAKAVKAVLAEIGKTGGDQFKALSNIIRGLPIDQARALQKALGLSDATFDTLRKGGAALDALRGKIEGLGTALTKVDQQNLKNLSNAFKSLGATIDAATQTLGARFASQLIELINAAERSIEDLAELPFGEVLMRSLEGVGMVLKQVFVDSWVAIGSDAVNSFMTNFISPIREAAANLPGAIMSGLQLLGGMIASAASAAGQSFLDGFLIPLSTLPGLILNALQSGLEGLIGIATSAGTAVADAFISGFNSLLSSVQSILQTISGWFDALAQKARDIWSAIKSGAAGAGDEPGGIPMAHGGLIGGRGTGTSDSNLAWVSRGEHIMPARVVRRPGMLAFLEALRRSGGNLRGVLDDMGRFARGGLVLPVPAFAGGGLNTGGSSSRTMHLTIGSETFHNLSVPESTALSLERFAVHSQIASTGRKPSWRR